MKKHKQITSTNPLGTPDGLLGHLWYEKCREELLPRGLFMRIRDQLDTALFHKICIIPEIKDEIKSVRN